MVELLLKGQSVFGRFVIETMHDGGGQAIGYFAQDTQARHPWERKVFLKQYHDLIPGSGEANALRQHFEALRTRLGDNDHFLCLPILVAETANSVIAAFPKIVGVSLREQMDQISESQCTRFAQAITNSVRILHKAGVAHLDLKPENVLIEKNRKTGKEYARLIDTDAARIDGVGLRRRVYGSENYMSPEHFDPNVYGDVSTKSDVFTIGIMLFELLFKCHPFARPGIDYRTAVRAGNIVLPRHEYHDDIVQRVMMCLRAKPDRRPEIGWVHSTLHTHSLAGFRKSGLLDRKGPYIQITGIADPSFRRTYFSGAILGRSNFRGCRMGPLPSQAFALHFGPWGPAIELRDSSASISVDGRPLLSGQWQKLKDGSILEVAGTRFSVQLHASA